MILYDPDPRPPLSEYGIAIPIAPDASQQALANLGKDPKVSELLEESLAARADIQITASDLKRVHSEAYVQRLYSAATVEKELERTYELLDSEGNYHRYDPTQAKRPLRELFDYALATVAGSYQCCLEALEHSSCFYLGGGMHHAKQDTGDGFCPVNDVVLAARKIQAEQPAAHIWILDLDVHKGDGTAALTAGDESICTLSIHMARGWPLDRDTYRPDGTLHPSHIPSDVDIPIEPGAEDVYLPNLAWGLEQLDGFSRPDLAIVLYGADPYEKDRLPSAAGINLTLDQMFERDRLVYRFLRERSIPRAYLRSGGYGIDAAEPLTQFLRWYLLEENGR
ncbi:MAG: histone deacetylase family protein [Spirochaetota bacterium]